MSMLLNALAKQLGGPMMGQLAGQIGASETQTGAAVSTALPMLVSALARNAASTQGAESLGAALARDHDGSVLDNISGLLAGQATGKQANGAGILGHLLGAQQGRVEQAVSTGSGLDAGSVAKLLPMLAPIVMGMLGKTKKEQGLDVGGLMSMLGGERDALEQQTPGMAGMVGQLLDADGDGSVADDLLKMGGGMLGGLLGRK